MPDLSVRVREPELMDGIDLERDRHVRALDALARVNRVSLASSRVWSEVLRLSRDGVQPIRVLDVACGGGDVLHDVARRARRHGVDVELHGCDVSTLALARASERGPRGAALRFFELDVHRDPLPGGYHLLCSSLFLHHLSPEFALTLLQAMARVTERALLVQDLRRTRLGYVFAWLGLLALTRSDVARADGLVSVRAAFTLEEARALCGAAGLDDAEVRACWPQRFVLRWRRP